MRARVSTSRGAFAPKESPPTLLPYSGSRNRLREGRTEAVWKGVARPRPSHHWL